MHLSGFLHPKNDTMSIAFTIGETAFLLGILALFVALRKLLRNRTKHRPLFSKGCKDRSKTCNDWPLGAYTDQNYLCQEPKPKVYLKSDAEIRAAAMRIYPNPNPKEKWHVQATGTEAVKIEKERAQGGIPLPSQKKIALFRDAKIAALLKEQSGCGGDNKRSESDSIKKML